MNKVFCVFFILLISVSVNANDTLKGVTFLKFNLSPGSNEYIFQSADIYTHRVSGMGPAIKESGTYILNTGSNKPVIHMDYVIQSDEMINEEDSTSGSTDYYYHVDNGFLFLIEKDLKNKNMQQIIIYSKDSYKQLETSYSASSVFIEDKNKPELYQAEVLGWMNAQQFWVEGKKDYGIGETITLDIVSGKPAEEYELNDDPMKYDLKGFIIMNGSYKSDYLYKNNSRVKKIEITLDNGKKYNINIADTFQPQVFMLDDAGPVTSATFKIIDIYKGKKWKDTCITKIILFSGEFFGSME